MALSEIFALVSWTLLSSAACRATRRPSASGSLYVATPRCVRFVAGHRRDFAGSGGFGARTASRRMADVAGLIRRRAGRH